MFRAIRIAGWTLIALLAVLVVAIAVVWHWRPGMELIAAHELPPAARDWPDGEVRIVWFGVSTVAISDGEHGLMIDPFLSRPGIVDVALDRPLATDDPTVAHWLRRAGIGRLDAILAGHSHYDHVMDVAVSHALTGGRVYGSPSTVNVAIGHGVPREDARVLEPERPLQFGRFTVTMIPSAHAGATGGRPTGEIRVPLPTPAPASAYRQGGTYSILVEHPSGRLLYHGSAGYLPGALRGYPADAVLLGVALIDDLPAYLAEVVDRTGATRVIPVHWDDFTRPLDAGLSPMPGAVDLPAFFDYLREQRPDLTVQTLPMGVPVTLFPSPEP